MRAVPPRWLHDGTAVIVVVYEGLWPSQTPAFHVLDVRSGSFLRLVARAGNGQQRTDTGVLLRDSRTLYVGARTGRPDR